MLSRYVEDLTLALEIWAIEVLELRAVLFGDHLVAAADCGHRLRFRWWRAWGYHNERVVCIGEVSLSGRKYTGSDG